MAIRPWFLGLVAAALCACANGLIEDASPTDGGLRPDSNNPLPPAADASRPDTSVPGDGGVDGSKDGAIDAAAEAAVIVKPPLVDGTIQPNEYGVHTDGQNQQASAPGSGSTTWYMTWTETNLYVAVSAANVAEGVVIYVDDAPLTPSNSGTNADGSLAGVLYDNGKVGTLPFRADFVAYIKSGYNEYRTADGANGWSTPTASAINVQGLGATREVAIPWSLIRAAGRPSSFSWLGYATSIAGYVYGAMPSDNAAGTIGQNALFSFFYKVIDATPGTGTKPFAVKLSP